MWYRYVVTLYPTMASERSRSALDTDVADVVITDVQVSETPSGAGIVLHLTLGSGTYYGSPVENTRVVYTALSLVGPTEYVGVVTDHMSALWSWRDAGTRLHLYGAPSMSMTLVDPFGVRVALERHAVLSRNARGTL